MRECEKATQKGKVDRNAWELFKSFDPHVSFYFTTSNTTAASPTMGDSSTESSLWWGLFSEIPFFF